MSQSADVLGVVFVLRDDGIPGMDGLLVGGLIKELQVWQVQEALQ